MEMLLINRQTRMCSPKRLRLKASLLYSNSQPVRAAPGEELLTEGPTVLEMVNGRATFTLKALANKVDL